MPNRQTAVKVRMKAHGQRAKTVYCRTFEKIEGTKIGTLWVGEEVNKDGGTPHVKRIHVVGDDAIVSQTTVVMNHHYAKFE